MSLRRRRSAGNGVCRLSASNAQHRPLTHRACALQLTGVRVESGYQIEGLRQNHINADQNQKVKNVIHGGPGQ